MNPQTSLRAPGELSAEGFKLMKVRDYDQALRLFLMAADLYAREDDLKNHAAQLQVISEIYRLTDKIIEAVNTCEALLALYAETEEYEQMFRVLNNMGLLEIGLKKYESALMRFKNALKLTENLDNIGYKALQLGNIGSTYRDMNKSEEAILYYEKALGIYEESGRRECVADQYTNIAYINVVEKRFKTALELYKKALPVYMETENTDKVRFTIQNIEKLEAVINIPESGR